MSDTPVGPGWWQASDGKFYAPEQHPDYTPPPPAPKAKSMKENGPMSNLPPPPMSSPSMEADEFASPQWMADLHLNQFGWRLPIRIAWWALLWFVAIPCWAATKANPRVRYGAWAAIGLALLIGGISSAADDDAVTTETAAEVSADEPAESEQSDSESEPATTLDEGVEDSSDADEPVTTTEAPAETTEAPEEEAVTTTEAPAETTEAPEEEAVTTTTAAPAPTTTAAPASTTTAAPAPTTTAAPASTTTAAPAPTTTAAPTADPRTAAYEALSFEQKQAVDTANDYFRYSSFSREGIIGQLEYEGFSNVDAAAAIDYFEQFGLIDWNAQAVAEASSYLEYSSFSRQGLIDQLVFEGFTTAQSTFGVDAQVVDWNAQAVAMAGDYLEYSSFSRQGLIDQLVFEGFTTAQATFGADAFFD